MLVLEKKRSNQCQRISLFYSRGDGLLPEICILLRYVSFCFPVQAYSGTSSSELVTVSATASSADTFYDGLTFRFTVYVRPVMAGGTVSNVVSNPDIVTVINSTDGVEISFPPDSLPLGIEMTVDALDPSELACNLDATRFRPFGYKEVRRQPLSSHSQSTNAL
jgi:hypothetical protein